MVTASSVFHTMAGIASIMANLLLIKFTSASHTTLGTASRAARRPRALRSTAKGSGFGPSWVVLKLALVKIHKNEEFAPTERTLLFPAHIVLR